MTKKVSLLLVVSIIMSNIFIYNSYGYKGTYTGFDGSQDIVKNIDFQDVADKTNYWAKDAIYNMAALEIIKGYGDKNFYPTKTITNKEAIALIYRSIGMENVAKAQPTTTLPQITDNWSKGYVALAIKDGLISGTVIENPNVAGNSLNKNVLVLNDFAKRQDIAFWIAKALKLAPQYNDRAIYNSFNDYKDIDFNKLPFVEAILEQKIMNGHPNGYFLPNNNIKREEMAQVLKNMQDLIYEKRGFKKYNGYIESITKETADTNKTQIEITSTDGEKYLLEVVNNKNADKKQELSPNEIADLNNDVIVKKGETLGTTEILEEKDNIEYIVDDKNNVRYINVLNYKNTKQEGFVDGIDYQNYKITIKQDNKKYTYPMKKEGIIIKNEKNENINIIGKDDFVELHILNGIVNTVYIKNPNIGQAETLVKGIIEEVNIPLKYISIYDQYGNTVPKTYNYDDSNLEVYKNGQTSNLESLSAGDSVYLQITDNIVEKIGAKTNFVVKYGTINGIIQNNKLPISFSDESYSQIPLDKDLVVIKDNNVVGQDELKDGTKVKLSLNVTPNETTINKVTILDNIDKLGAIYKGQLGYFSNLKDSITARNISEYIDFRWQRQDNGYMSFKLDPKVKIYYNNIAQDTKNIKDQYNSKYIYATTIIADNTEYVKEIDIFDNNLGDKDISDKVLYVYNVSSLIKLTNGGSEVYFNNTTKFIKENRLVSSISINPGDNIYINSVKDNSGKQFARVVEIKPQQIKDVLKLYRGMVKNIVPQKSFSLKDYAQLNGNRWDYTNYEKTFNMTYDTRIISDNGPVSVRDFVYIDDPTYKDANIYVVSDGFDAKLVSLTSWGAFNLKGEIYSITGDGTNKTIRLINTTKYDRTTGLWEGLGNLDITVVDGTIILNGNENIDFNDLAVGDKLNIFKQETSNQANLIFVQNF